MLKVQNKVRKLYRLKENIRAVNLSPYVPNDWEYVEVHLNSKSASIIVLTLIKIGVDKIDANLSGTVRKATK